jgi:DNA-binding NtrC family response regulator
MGQPVALFVAASGLLQPLRPALEAHGFAVVESACHAAAQAVRTSGPALALIGAHGEPIESTIDVVRGLRAADPALPVMLVTDSSSEDLAIAALKAGISDYFRAPFEAAALVAAACALRGPEPGRGQVAGLPEMVGRSDVMREIRTLIERLARSETSVLITGETGTGKDLVARLLHGRSRRRHQPFVSINCAAIPDSLLESELFGHERGAFTGAEAASAGHLAAAKGGTVLLDEIGEMTPYAQAKMLRALDAREVYRLGSTRRIPLDIRVIAATNQDLDDRIADGRFRRDLYYRLNVSRVQLPPIRDRREDIPALVDHYVAELNGRFRRHVRGFTSEALDQLVAYDWPGNVREIRNVLENAFAALPASPLTWLETPAAIRARLARRATVAHTERDRLLAALAATNWNVSLAARRLSWSRMTLYRKLSKYHLARES